MTTVGHEASSSMGIKVLQPLLAAVAGETTAAVLSAFPGDADVAERASERVAIREKARQTRLEAIFSIAIGLMAESNFDGQPEAGWLNHFIECAQDAETELEQTVWASLLANELSAPGSVVRRTMSFLRDMDVWELESFKEYCAFAFAFEGGWRFMFDEELAQREMWSYGREIDLTQHWIGIGLLANETARIEPGAVRGLRIRYCDRIWEIKPDAEVAGETENEVKGIVYRKFTVTGQQIAGALKTKPFNGYARNLINALNTVKSAGLTALELEGA